MICLDMTLSKRDFRDAIASYGSKNVAEIIGVIAHHVNEKNAETKTHYILGIAEYLTTDDEAYKFVKSLKNKLDAERHEQD